MSQKIVCSVGGFYRTLVVQLVILLLRLTEASRLLWLRICNLRDRAAYFVMLGRLRIL
jgi:hypothetical protein